ncbi:MAG: SDR family oxidoreductase [Bellilinea sp.]
MNGKVCMVTGATSGMGEMTARRLAELGATVILVGRNRERGDETLRRIMAATGNTAVELMLADLSSQAQIRQLVQQFKSRYQHLHVLVNNAGAWITTRQESIDGIEMTFALNHLGYFSLTNLLLDTLKASAPARIINVSSYGHKRTQMNFDNLQAKQRYDGLQAYRQSKLANILFTYELARRLAGTGVTVNAVNPGLVATRFGFNNFGFIPAWIVNLLTRVYGLVGTNAEQGAQTSIYLATSSNVEGVTGKYFEKQTAVPSSEESNDPAVASRLWQVSIAMTGHSV